MKRKATLRARTGTYRDRQTGQEKNSYATVGHILERDNGDVWYKLDTLPVNFDGWLFPGELGTKDARDALQGKDAAAEQGVSPPQQRFDDDIPF